MNGFGMMRYIDDRDHNLYLRIIFNVNLAKQMKKLSLGLAEVLIKTLITRNNAHT